MPFADYDELKAEIASWLDRTDLTTEIPGFIELAEGYANRKLRTQQQYAVVEATADSEYLALPDDWLETSNIDRDDRVWTPLEYLTPAQLVATRREHPTQGRPRAYSVVGGRLRLLPEPDSSYTLRMEYYQKIPALSDNNTSNWLLENHPDVYLHGALFYANKYLRDPEGMAIAKADLDEALAEIYRTDQNAGIPKTPRMRAKVIG